MTRFGSPCGAALAGPDSMAAAKTSKQMPRRTARTGRIAPIGTRPLMLLLQCPPAAFEHTSSANCTAADGHLTESAAISSVS